MASLTQIAALTATLLALAGCEAEVINTNVNNLLDFGNPPEEPQEPSREAAKPGNEPEDVNTDPPVNAGPEPCPGSVFSVLTCDDNGVDWHWLDSNRNWVT